ncbi:DUF305 domain-containing protein [Alkalibacter mobilis]|uniref:DUF305 domain-containing protein n=1 Tax=Alkalibacter mobilis TaxID=2787712 RepID=UPI00189F0197|nr:DUF305 domain-containing protein [Alkalibacter mobilis]MBF7096823.1 DUF305 domain-containing protein [Alkalibacter mobilis]
MKKKINKIVILLLLVVMAFFTLGMGPGMMRGNFEFVDSEYEYLLHMIPHHEEAVRNAKILRDNTVRSEMQDFAEQIIETQQEEIDLMKEWLEIWYPDRPHEIEYEPMMGNYEGLTGQKLDENFLEDMIPHHIEAVRMSQQLIQQGLAEHVEVEELAISIRSKQMDEIHQMSAWLNEWFNEDSVIFDRMPMLWNQREWYFLPLILIGVGIVAIIVAIILILGNKRKSDPLKNNAKELLDRRFAQGEITEEEYLRAKNILEEK